MKKIEKRITLEVTGNERIYEGPGRPSLPPEKKGKCITVYLHPITRKQLKELRRFMGLEPSPLMAKLIEDAHSLYKGGSARNDSEKGPK